MVVDFCLAFLLAIFSCSLIQQVVLICVLSHLCNLTFSRSSLWLLSFCLLRLLQAIANKHPIQMSQFGASIAELSQQIEPLLEQQAALYRLQEDRWTLETHHQQQYLLHLQQTKHHQQLWQLQENKSYTSQVCAAHKHRTSEESPKSNRPSAKRKSRSEFDSSFRLQDAVHGKNLASIIILVLAHYFHSLFFVLGVCL
jgi:hypothetical protein